MWLPDDCKLTINQKKGNYALIFWNDINTIFFVIVCLVSCLVTGSGFMSISWLLLELWQFSFIKDWPEILKLEIPYLSFDQYLEIKAS